MRFLTAENAESAEDYFIRFAHGCFTAEDAESAEDYFIRFAHEVFNRGERRERGG